MNHSKSRTDIPLLFKRLPWPLSSSGLTPEGNITIETQLSEGRTMCPRADALGAAQVFSPD
jgi:hypothetical protein